MMRATHRRPTSWCAMLTAACALAPIGVRLVAQGTSPSAAAPVTWATITYLSGGTIYLEVGIKQGVREGTPIEVVRSGEVIAQLAAKYVSSTRTACTIASGTMPLVVGDSVRFHPVVTVATTAANPASPMSAAAARQRAAPLRGRIGLRYLLIQEADGTTLTQPAVDLRLDGTRLGGTGLGLAVDVRAQRTEVTGGSSTGTSPAASTRVYSAAVTFQPGITGARWALGRQFATALSPIGIFDGAALDLNYSHWSTGFLAGTQPDAVSFSPSGEITEYGVWVQRHNGPGSHTPWSATVGAIGSYDFGQINREFLYLRTTYNSRHFSLYAAEEVDANRGWKLAVEGSSITPTSTFATAQLNVSDALSMSAGVDSRRTVRLYRDFVNPEIVFDDAFRQGSWGELSLRLSSHLRLSTDARWSDGGMQGGAQAITASLFANRITPLHLGLRVRSTQYTGPLSEGMLTSVALDAAPSNALRLSLNAGQRTSMVPGSGVAATRLTWTGADLDVALGRSLYVMLSTYREAGTPTASIQSYAALSWRF
jgi:hypothetical protein